MQHRMNGQDISIQLTHEGGGALCRQIAHQLAEGIRRGRLPPRTRLPAARDLARRLGVNPATVVTAYRQLVRDGLVESHSGRGTVVCPPLTAAPADGAAGASPLESLPDLDLFPTAAVRRVILHILDTEGGRAFGYDEPGGYPPLQASIRRYLEQGGIDCGGQTLTIFSGAQQGLSVISSVFLNRGDWVLVERPTYPGILRLLRRAGAQVEAVDVGPGGPDLRAVERVLATRPVRLAYLMPVYQNPTGVCYRESVARRMLQLCAAHGVMIVEDDTLSDLDFGAGRHRPLRALAGPAADLLYLKSFSRLLLPGFRLGFCLAPERHASVLRRAKEEADLFTSGFFQRVLHLLLAHGYFAEHLAELEKRERRRFRAAVAEARRELLPVGFRLLPPAGGPRLWCLLPPGVAPERFAAACAERRLAVAAGTEFSPDGATATGLSLVYGGVAPAAWTALLRALRRTVAALQ